MIYGIKHSDGSWLRNDGYTNPVGVVSGAWTGSKERAEYLISIGLPLEPATAEPIPVITNS